MIVVQVHFRVWRRYHGLSYGEFQWFKYLAGGYMRMARGTAGTHLGGVLKVDCANGIGADKLQYLGRCPGAKPQGYYFEVVNAGEGKLNHLCGADYVQKDKKFPAGFESMEEDQRWEKGGGNNHQTDNFNSSIFNYTHLCGR